MRNSLSGFVAEKFMAYFETKISKNPRFPRVWLRFMDDIFIITNKRKVLPTLEWLNSMDTIKFTKEDEKDIP